VECPFHGIGPRPQCWCEELRLAPLLFPLRRLLATGFFAVTASATMSAGKGLRDARPLAPALTAASPGRRTKRGRGPARSGAAAFKSATSRYRSAHHAGWHDCGDLPGVVTCPPRSCSSTLCAALHGSRSTAALGDRRVADTFLGAWLAMGYTCAVVRRTGGFLESGSSSHDWKSPA
jgi:hypothetical protein